MKKTKIKRIPRFKTEDEERDFWATHDATEYFDTSRPLKVSFPNLRPSTRSVTVRLPESLVLSLKMLANKKDVPYQSLLKIFLAERVQKELQL